MAIPKAGDRYKRTYDEAKIVDDKAEDIRSFLASTPLTRVCARLIAFEVLGCDQPSRLVSKRINNFMFTHTGWASVGKRDVREYGIHLAFERIPFKGGSQ